MILLVLHISTAGDLELSKEGSPELYTLGLTLFVACFCLWSLLIVFVIEVCIVERSRVRQGGN